MNIIFNILSNLLNYLFSFTGDWGITIVLLTSIVRLFLLPISLKQKASITEQQLVYRKIEEIKIKYKNNKKKLELETQKQYKGSSKSILGCLVSLLQFPVVISLYNVITNMSVQAGTMIIPWVSSIKMHDQYFIIPIIYALISLSPNILSSIPYFKSVQQAKMTKVNLIIISVFSVLITIKTPIAVGIYLITTGLFSLFEEVGYRLYIKDKCLN